MAKVFILQSRFKIHYFVLFEMLKQIEKVYFNKP